MKNAMDGAVVGAGTGVLTTASILLAGVFLKSGRIDGSTATSILLAVTVVAGLVYLFAGMILGGKLQEWTDAGRSRGSVLALGFLLGLPVCLPIPALLWTILLLSGHHDLAWISDPEMLTALGAITTGGGSMGLACAWIVSRPPKEHA